VSLVPVLALSPSLVTLPAVPAPVPTPGLDGGPVAALGRLARVATTTAATLESAVESVLRTATGPEGFVLVFLYSFLCAVVLPLPGELVLAVPVDLGWSQAGELLAVVAVASTAKAAGALAALPVARGAVSSGPVARLVERVPRSRSDSGLTGRLAGVTDRYGYLGLVGALAVPFAPDTAVIYAFSVVEPRRAPFAAAAFVGTVLRLAIVAGVASAVLSLV
jgi:uncharacterized membrane protein YdjX (TVP38/TMEM64 family)